MSGGGDWALEVGFPVMTLGLLPARGPRDADAIVVGGGGGSSKTGVPNALVTVPKDGSKIVHTTSTGDRVARSIAVHPLVRARASLQHWQLT